MEGQTQSGRVPAGWSPRRWPRTVGPETIALILRVGLGLVVLTGGVSKLSQLLDPGRRAAILEQYWGPGGYVNAFVDEYLFSGRLGDVLTPWIFLTSLSAFEFVSGALLLVGALVRPLALVWAVLFWTFMAALPVATVAGAVGPELVTHRTPALLVLIRDVGLSGLFAILFMIGSGKYSLDERWIGPDATRRNVNRDAIGLVARFAVALPILVGSAFHGYGHIQSFGVPAWVLALVAMALILNVGPRVAGLAMMVMMTWFLIDSFDPARSLVANMNAVKREYAFLAAGLVIGLWGGGHWFSLRAGRAGWSRLLRPGSTPAGGSAVTGTDVARQS